MKEKKAGERLTLEEMFDIFEGDIFEEYRKKEGIKILLNDQGRKYIKDYPYGWWYNDGCPLICQYILAEQMLPENGTLDIEFKNDGTFTLEWELSVVHKWVNPLVWAREGEYFANVIQGHFAIPLYDSSRIQIACALIKRHANFRVLFFADGHQIANEDLYHRGFMKGMHVWDVITGDYSELYAKVLSGDEVTIDDIQRVKQFNPMYLRNSILVIANERGGKRAAEILRLFQSEWPRIKVWKNALQNMSHEEVTEFEDCLMCGFDDLLAEWEKAPSQDASNVAQGTLESKGDESIFRTNIMSRDMCERKLLEILNGSGTKADVVRRLRDDIGQSYFYTDKKHASLARILNSWIPFSMHSDWTFNGDDFRKTKQ